MAGTYKAMSLLFFGYNCGASLCIQGNVFPNSAWNVLERPLRYPARTTPRARPQRVKRTIVEKRGFKDIRLIDEWVAEFTDRLPQYVPHYRGP